MAVLRWLCAAGCLAAASAERARAGFAEIEGANATLLLATDGDLLAVRSGLQLKLAEVQAALDSAVAREFEAVDKAEREEALALQLAASQVLSVATARLALLQVQERRLTLVLRHGLHGRCCCRGSGSHGCHWVDAASLEGSGRLCPAASGTDYVDQYAGSTGSKDHSSMSRLLDACLGSSGWLMHIGDAATVPEDEPIAALQAIEELAGVPEEAR